MAVFRLKPSGWQGDGILARIARPDLAAALRERGIPVVDFTFSRYGFGLPCLCIES